MILEEFSKFLNLNNEKPVEVLTFWLVKKLGSQKQDRITQAIQKELYFAKNKYGNFMIMGKSPSGRRLLKTLYNYAVGYENQNTSRFIHNLKPKDFKEF